MSWNIKFKTFFILCTSFLAIGLSGCIAEAPPEMERFMEPAEVEISECVVEKAALCKGHERQSYNPCERDEIGCRAHTFSGACADEMRTVYCRLADDCSADIEFSCPEGREACDPNDDGPCELAFEGQGPCQPDVYCTPRVVCRAQPTCMDGAVETEEPCDADELSCEAVSACGQTVYCRMDDMCDAVPTCERWEDSGLEESCADWEGDTCRAVTECGATIFCRTPMACTDGPESFHFCPEGMEVCDPSTESGCQRVQEREWCTPELYCKPSVQCDAEPDCPEQFVQRDAPCTDQDVDCQTFEMCGHVIFCEPSPQVCDREFMCSAAEFIETEEPCLEGEQNCYVEDFGACGVLYCRLDAECEAQPSCGEFEEESAIPCDEGEDCRMRALCGEVIYCRPRIECMEITRCGIDQEYGDEPPQREERRCETEVVCRPIEEG